MFLTPEEEERLCVINVQTERAVILNSKLKRLGDAIERYDREHINHAMNAATSHLEESDVKEIAELIRAKLLARDQLLKAEMAGLREKFLGK